MANMQAPVEVLLYAGAPVAGATAHARTIAPKPDVPNPNNPWDGTPTTAWPACMKKPLGRIPDGQWSPVQGVRAVQLGAVACPEPACFGGVAGAL